MSAEVPYGEWPSPITPEKVVEASVGLGEVRAEAGQVFWSELRPSEGGRVQIVRRRPDGTNQDLLPDGFSARTRVHEYGGGAWLARLGWVYFANWDDQRVYRLRVDDEGPVGEPEAITPELEARHALRYADFVLGGPYLVAVRERHGGQAEPRNEIVAVDVRGGTEPVVLFSGPDFVSTPQVAPGGELLAWVEWDHPDMPWDSTRLRLAPIVLVDGAASMATPLTVAGGPGESVTMPRFAPNGVLHFCSDRNGWWNLYALHGGNGSTIPVAVLDGEIGVPQWVFGQQRYDFLTGGRIAIAWTAGGLDHLGVVDRSGAVHELDLDVTEVSSLATSGSGICFAGASFTAEPEVRCVGVDGTSVTDTTVLRPARDLGLDQSWISVGSHVSFPSGDRTAHGLHYPPTNPDARGPDGSAPPVLVSIHGGPTGAARARLNLAVQFWTSRGFGVVDVNYGGSTGYGRPYRELLADAWGVVDVEDCEAAVRFLAERGEADAGRLLIHGGSAGGFTTLAALAFGDTFSAGASSYGVADLEALATETHKFESRYLDGLIGPYPEARSTYEERSPIHHTDRLDRPLIVFQGTEDEIVPPNQSEMIVEALKAKGVPVAYLAFEGEQHGFRRAETVVTVLGSELAFYGAVLGFRPPGDLPPVEIHNL